MPMQWPPCYEYYYEDWAPPMELYQPCNNNVNPINPINPENLFNPMNPDNQILPDQDYWTGQIFPDCCVYECSVECFPAPEPWEKFTSYSKITLLPYPH